MLSEHYQRVKRTIFINNQLRKYYGKKYHRSSPNDKSGGTQTRFLINQARAGKGRLSESTTGIDQGKENQVMII